MKNYPNYEPQALYQLQSMPQQQVYKVPEGAMFPAAAMSNSTNSLPDLGYYHQQLQ